ncbi:MAG: hypothetical protein H0X37_25515 [Herpetosiphonaceae bacterium]|nr:hypothetical protein [Herpetosiphonaceae bacterium]
MGPVNPQALNRYSYGLNNPVKYTDPSGHKPCADCESGGGGPSSMGGGGGCLLCLGALWQWVTSWFSSGEGEQAVEAVPIAAEVSEGKLSYLLEQDAGKANALRIIGFTEDNREELRQVLVGLGHQVDLTTGEAAQFGMKYRQVVDIVGPNGISARLTVVWQIDHGSAVCVKYFETVFR